MIDPLGHIETCCEGDQSMAICHKCLIAIVTVLTFIGTISRTYAFYPLHSSFKINSSDLKYTFVMISPTLLSEELKPFTDEDKRDRIRAIRSLYSKSGLYRNDGSSVPLWTVDWYSTGVDVTSDGVHLVRHRNSSTSLNEEAISFFANGVLIRSYSFRELIDFPSLASLSLPQTDWIETKHRDDNQLRYSITTCDGNQFTFDLQTGEIVSASHPGRSLIGSVLILMTVILCGTAWIIKRKRKQIEVRFIR
ncbi:MAG: hypothetical protein U0798_20130 [Gemmataceae bacterium]